MNDMSDIPQDLLTQSIAGRRLDNKCIILTGAAGSIGSYITRQLLREGARVMLTGLTTCKNNRESILVKVLKHFLLVGV